MNKVLCKKCICWVDCGEKEKRPYGFCLSKDLFTYTAETKCGNFIKGVPFTEAEWEDAQSGVKNAGIH